MITSALEGIRNWFSASLAERTDLTHLSHRSSRANEEQDSKGYQERIKSRRMSLAHFAPMSIGIQAEITHGDLVLVWNMGGNTGDELRIIHVLQAYFFSPAQVIER